MLASRYFKVPRRTDDDWFDPIVNADTKLFLDPFLLFKERTAFWEGAHQQIVNHFDHAFRLIAEGNMNPESVPYKKALHLLVFKEPKEFCLGYTAKGTSGAGGGLGYARSIAAAIADAIRRGLKHPKHFEELGILNEGIGADRISDITCTVLKARLIEYTRKISETHRLPLARHRIFASGFDARRLRWEMEEVEVLTNPTTGGPLLLVPARFLRDLPILNADDWWSDYENEQLRQDVNYEIMGHVDKATIVDIARRNPGAVRRWTVQKERDVANAYDFDRDPKGVWQWDLAATAFTSAHPLVLTVASSEEQFLSSIEKMIDQYRLYVEEQGGWELLWDVKGRMEKPEHAAQLLFRGIVANYCKANDISIDPEVNLGRGPVDFKFSRGHTYRAHLEVKKLENGKFWNGLERQLPSYMKSDEVKNGWLVAIRYRAGRQWDKRVLELQTRVSGVARDQDINVKYRYLDARPKRSASKL